MLVRHIKILSKCHRFIHWQGICTIK
ncbi:MAG: hypothetical protein LBT48_01835 [Prevotellaceae bacterium]|nr:hypothetical protein [Prevotellaceae bacterium]